MATENQGANSPASTSTGEETAGGKGNLTMGQAAALLFSNIEKEAKQAEPKLAAEKISPEIAATVAATETHPESSAAEATPASESAETEATPAAETTEAAPETEEHADTVLSPKISFTPEQQELFNKRIQRETAKTKAIESQMAEARARLASLETEAHTLRTEKESATQTAKTPPQVVSFGNQPLAEVSDIPTLAKLQQSAKEAIRFVEETLDNPRAWKLKPLVDPDTNEPVLDEGGNPVRQRITAIGDKVYTEAELKASMRRAKVTLEDQIPARAAFLTTQNQEQQRAFTQFPWMKDKASPEYQQAQAARRDYPWLSALPNADWIIGVQVMGMKAIEAAATAAKSPPVKPKIAPAKPANDQAAVSASGAAPRAAIGSNEKAALSAERARLSKKGGIDSADAATLLMKSQSIRNSR